MSEDGQIEYLNSTYADLLGYEREDLVGEHWEILYYDDNTDEIYNEVLPAAREGRWQGQTRLRRRDGDGITVEHTLSYTDDGSLICTLSDPTPDEAVETELTVKTRAMDKAPIGISLTDPTAEDNPLIYVNNEFTTLTGYDEDEVSVETADFCRESEQPTSRDVDSEMQSTPRNRLLLTFGTTEKTAPNSGIVSESLRCSMTMARSNTSSASRTT